MKGTPAQNVDVVWCMMKEFCATHHVTSQYTTFSIKTFTDPEKHRSDYPRLKGRGHEVKSALRPITHIWKHCSNKVDVEHKMIQEMLDIICDIEDAFDEHVGKFVATTCSRQCLVIG